MAEPAIGATPHLHHDRDLSQYSDHITVWVDRFIGEDREYEKFKKTFHDQVQVLQSNNYTEKLIDDESMLCTDPKMLEDLGNKYYCLEYFSAPAAALKYIHNNANKKIFFISSGTIGKLMVPELVKLPQIQGIYIFCGSIAHHVEWATEYYENISAMLEHQDDLLTRLTRDIGKYVEKKGDEHKDNEDVLQARNCYAWAKKLYVRCTMMGDGGAHKCLENIDIKLDEAQSSAQSPSDP